MSSFIPMGSKIVTLTPEIIVFGGSVLVSIIGLSRSKTLRKSVPRNGFAQSLAAT